MKNVISLCFSFLSIVYLLNHTGWTQIQNCTTIMGTDSVAQAAGCYNHYIYNSGNYEPADTLHVKLVFHLLQRNDGSGLTGWVGNKDSLIKLFNKARAVFMRSNIRISLECALDTVYFIRDTELYNYFSTTEKGELLAGYFRKSNVVNVFIANTVSSGRAFPFKNGYVPYGNIILNDGSIVNADTVYAKIFVHELGHVFGLYHTFETQPGIENITRDSTDVWFNCYRAGDLIFDTPAQREGVFTNCVFTDSTGVDSAGVHYMNPPDSTLAHHPDSKNYMCSTDDCRDTFEAEQIRMMRCHISSWPSTNELYNHVVVNRTESGQQLGDSLMVYAPANFDYQDAEILLRSGSSFRTKPSVTNSFTATELIGTLKHKHWQIGFDTTTRRNTDVYSTSLSEPLNTREAYFDTTYSAMIRTYVDGALLPLRFYFKNPWYIDYQSGFSKFGNYTQNQSLYRQIIASSYTPPNGAFKNRNYNFSLPNTWYAAKILKGLRQQGLSAFNPIATNAQTGDYIFTNLFSNRTEDTVFIATTDTSLQKAIIFKDNDHRIDLNYKSYLASVDVNPFTTNSQRHLCYDKGKFYLAYSSNNGIYLSEKDSLSSSNWSIEKKLNFGFNGSYSIDANEGLVFAVAAGDTNWKLLEYNRANGNTSLSSFTTFGGTANRPVVAVKNTTTSDTIITSVAEKNNAVYQSGLSVGVMKRNKFDDYTQLSMTPISNTAGAVNPSLVCDKNGDFHLAWQEGKYVWYSKFSVDANGVVTILENKDQVSNCGGIRNGKKPSITVDQDNHPMVAFETEFYDVDYLTWSGTPQSQYRNAVAVRRKFTSLASSWGHEWLFPLKRRTSYDPVIGGNKEGSNKIAIVWWSDSTNGIRRIHSASGEAQSEPAGIFKTFWSLKTWSDSGYAPIIAMNNSFVPNAVYVKDSSLLGGVQFRRFAWTSDTATFGYASIGIDTVIEMRGAVVSNSDFNSGVAFTVFEDSLSGVEQQFVSISDTASAPSLASMKDFIQTVPFTASKIKLSLRRFADGIYNPLASPPVPIFFDTASVEWNVEIRNGLNDSLISTHLIGRLAKDEVMEGIDSISVSFPRQNVYVRMIVVVEAPDAIDCWNIVRTTPVSLGGDHWSRWTSTLKQNFGSRIISEEQKVFNLEQNHPNPFGAATLSGNPKTEIIYHVLGQEEKYVLLKVYDTFGREIMTLADGRLKPGRYSVTFDASSLPNGVYIYTLSCEGSTLSRRMTLLK